MDFSTHKAHRQFSFCDPDALRTSCGHIFIHNLFPGGGIIVRRSYPPGQRRLQHLVRCLQLANGVDERSRRGSNLG